jgi:hypothetical protein
MINVIKEENKDDVTIYVSSESIKDSLAFVMQLLKKLDEEGEE